MKIGVMQPYFFPYLGYFDLINQVDKWIVFDTPQYIRHGWVNRNRILHPESGWQYIILPLKKHKQETPINKIEITSNTEWNKKILAQLQHYKKHAPYFQETIEFMKECFDHSATNLAEFNTHLLALTCEELRIRFDFEYFSRMDLSLGTINNAGDWALRICQAVGGTEYINPPGGEAIFDKEEFAKNGIQLRIQQYENFKYSCNGREFIPSLSIIDVMMWNRIEDIKNHLDQEYSRQNQNDKRKSFN